MENNKPPPDSVYWLQIVTKIFGAREAVEAASKDEVIEVLNLLHAFIEQLRFVIGGAAHLPTEFWKADNQCFAPTIGQS